MAKIDEKLAFNQDLERQAEAERQAIESYYESLERLTEEDRAVRRARLEEVELRFREQVLPIQSREWGQNISVRQSEVIQQIAYGFCRIGGAVSFFTGDRGEEGEFTHLVVTLCGHEIDRITDLFLDGQKVSFNEALVDGEGKKLFGQSTGDWFPYVFLSGISRGAEDQPANSDLVAQSNILFPGKWTDSHRQRGCAHAYIWLFYAAEKFLNGPPEIALEGRWKTNIYDPRTETYGWTDNAALCMADYMMNDHFGMGLTLEDFDIDNLSEAADACDELVPLLAGGNEKRYTVNGNFLASRDNSHEAVLAMFCNAMAGDYVRTRGGKYLLYPGVWRAPTTSFSEKHLRGPVKVLAKPPRGRLFNGVKGKYRGPLSLWEKTDYPPFINANYRVDDGRTLWHELDLPLTSSPSMAQRIAKIFVERNRQGQLIEAPVSMAFLKTQAGLNTQFTLERLAILSKNYRIEKLEFFQNGPLLEGKVLLQETAAAVFDWDSGSQTAVDLAPNSDFPDPRFVQTPRGIDIGGGTIALGLDSGTTTLYKRSDGTIFTRLLVRWAAATDPFVLSAGWHEVQYKLSTEEDWIAAGTAPGSSSQLYILDVQDSASYDVRVRAITSSGKSAWLTRTGYSVIGKSEPPSVPTGFVAIASAQGVDLSWNDIADIDRSEYEVRLGASWGAGTVIFRGKATSFRHGFLAAGAQNFWLRAIDTSGNYSGSSAGASLTVNAPGVPGNLSALATHNNVRLSWTAPTSTFPIKEYKIFRDGSLLGTASATVWSTLEQVGGDYIYSVKAVDMAGNESLAAQIELTVNSPPLFELLYDETLDPAGADLLTNCAVENKNVIASVDNAETYSAHFTGNSWSTPQDQIDAGYPRYAQPANTANAIYQQTIDYGAVLGSALIVVQAFPVWIVGSGTVSLTVSYSNDGVSWTDVAGQTQVLGTNFRYARVRYEFDPNDDTSLVQLPPVRVRLEVTAATDSGEISANSADSGGTLIIPNLTFLDVFEDTIQLTFKGSSAYFPSFAISGNDVSVFLWDTSGNRVSGTVKWSFSGVVSDT